MKRTPFYQFHVDQGARLVDFAGWEMPIMYSSIIGEHEHVRSQAGLFDVSHMGRILFKGSEARRFLERICTRRLYDMVEGQARYTLICNERGGVKDDALVYKFNDREYMMVVNASNRIKLLDHFASHRGDLDFDVNDRTEKTGMIAIQGPKAMEIMSQFSSEVPTLKNYRFCVKKLMMSKITISRTGYTGEDGVEVILPGTLAATAVKLMLSQAGEVADMVKPIGLGARDTLRLEAGMPLYGHEMDEEMDPISAGLNFGINLDKDEHDDGEPFIGQDALKKIKSDGPTRKLVGLKIDGKRTPRQGMNVMQGDREIGVVTSGCASPTLGIPIAMAYVPADQSEPGTTVQVDLGKATADAEVCTLPFYKRPKPSKPA